MVSTRYKQCNNNLAHDLSSSVWRRLDWTGRLSGSNPEYGPNFTSWMKADEVLGHFQSTAVVPLGKVLNSQNSCEGSVLPHFHKNVESNSFTRIDLMSTFTWKS